MIILKWWYSLLTMNASSLTNIEFKHFCLTKKLNTKKKSCQRRTSTKNNFFLQKSYLKPYILQALLSDKKAALCQPRYCTFYAACLLTKNCAYLNLIFSCLWQVENIDQYSRLSASKDFTFAIFSIFESFRLITFVIFIIIHPYK